MKIIHTSQAENTAQWLEERRGRITGTKSGDIALTNYAQKDVAKLRAMADKMRESSVKARTAGKAEEYAAKAVQYNIQADTAEWENKRLKVTAGYWEYLAELWAEAPDGENPLERGHRLENENARKVLEAEGISEDKAEFDTGLWVSGVDDRLAVSPDVHEATPEGMDPTWAIECKSLGTPNHLAAVLPILFHREMARDGLTDAQTSALAELAARMFPEILEGGRRPFDYIPDRYKAQALQYFVVNPALKRLYFSFYDPRCYSPTLAHVYITVDRDTITHDIAAQEKRELMALDIAQALAEVTGALF